mmetsp:Transcript_19531/g.40477  ORF Transcript_19531/g.40477 Transcript_19531/m.40477 type:complete len:277 (+) Transcript_19531:214-1044(+)
MSDFRVDSIDDNIDDNIDDRVDDRVNDNKLMSYSSFSLHVISRVPRCLIPPYIVQSGNPNDGSICNLPNPYKCISIEDDINNDIIKVTTSYPYNFNYTVSKKYIQESYGPIHSCTFSPHLPNGPSSLSLLTLHPCPSSKTTTLLLHTCTSLTPHTLPFLVTPDTLPMHSPASSCLWLTSLSSTSTLNHHLVTFTSLGPQLTHTLKPGHRPAAYAPYQDSRGGHGIAYSKGRNLHLSPCPSSSSSSSSAAAVVVVGGLGGGRGGRRGSLGRCRRMRW